MLAGSKKNHACCCDDFQNEQKVRHLTDFPQAARAGHDAHARASERDGSKGKTDGERGRNKGVISI